ncbi:T6SS effector BTH_I2691 family protein, partial [Pseudomonas sp. HD6422]|uniref:T6SS effector BTH_I2691 family protein n=1 Tax=Pseudomonas sp. HD6422 TaxID=2860318 RepID=UPI0021BB08CF
ELNEARAAAQAVVDTAQEAENREKWNESPIGFKAYLPPVDIEAHTQRATKNKQEEARERLEERYDEKARAAFQAGYDREVKHWQTRIDKAGELYATLYGHRSFQRIAYFDYSATSPLSVEYFIQMLSACLAGGPTEKLPEQDDPLGPTQYLWQQLLEDPNSLLYQALTAKNQSLRQQLVKALSSNELTQVYHAVKAIATSSEGEQLMIKSVQDAIGQLLAGMASAGNALGKQISGRTRALIGHVHSSAFLLFAGQPITQVRLSLTLGEYMSLLSEALQERTDAFLGQLDKHFRRPAGRKVRATVLSGAIHLAAAENRSQMIEVMIWTLESAESLQARLTQLRESAVEGAGTLVRKASIGADTLRLSMRSVGDDLKIGAAAARSVASDGLRTLRTAASSPGSAKLLLALGSLWFQQETLRKNFEVLLETTQSNPEALAAIGSSTLGVMGAGIETTGLLMDLVRPGKMLNGTGATLSLGQTVAKFGGAITALAGLMDSAQYFHAASRAAAASDSNASRSCVGAGWVALFSTSAGVYAAFSSGALLGALGIAIILGFVAYMLALGGRHEESSALELWCRRSRWGMPPHERRWMHSSNFDASIGELNAAAIGLRADISIALRLQSPHHQASEAVIFANETVNFGFYLDLNIELPGFIDGVSSVKWYLDLYRPGGHKQDVSLWGDGERLGRINGLAAGTSDIFFESLPRLSCISQDKSLRIQAGLPLSENHGITAIQLKIEYWPDKGDDAGLAVVTVREDKLQAQMEDR